MSKENDIELMSFTENGHVSLNPYLTDEEVVEQIKNIIGN